MWDPSFLTTIETSKSRLQGISIKPSKRIQLYVPSARNRKCPAGFGIDCGAVGFIKVDPFDFQRGEKGVFAAGDAVSGAGTLIEAIASGRKAAIAVDTFLGGSGIIDEMLVSVSEPDTKLGPGNEFASRQRREGVCAPPKQRILNFDSVVQELDQQAAAGESWRCLQRDLSFGISSVKVWGNYWKRSPLTVRRWSVLQRTRNVETEIVHRSRFEQLSQIEACQPAGEL
jgi:hypothetical protein